MRRTRDPSRAARYSRAIAAGLAGALLLAAAGQPLQAQEAAVITLTQVPCQFLESENDVDRGYKSTRKADCDAINEATGEQRLAEAQVLRLSPGTYVFRVSNKNVPYDLGFWLREADYDWRNPLHHVTKLSVSGGGLKQGTSQDYEVELEPGEYLYSCPLNPTPDYRLVVE